LSGVRRRVGAPLAGLMILAALLAASLAFPPPAPAQTVIVDDLGRRVAFPRSPCRVVSLIPAATEIIYALGAEHCLAGRSTWDDYPPEVADVPDVGRAIGADVERVVARRPDVVLLIAGSDNARSVEDFQRLGVTSLVFRLNRLPELRSTIERLGRLLGRSAAADSLWSVIEHDLEDVRERTAQLERPVVYYDIVYPPPITIGRGSYLDSLIMIAGGRNAFHDVQAPSPTVSLEAIAVRDPEVILFPVGDAWTGAAGPAERPLWSNLRAVRTGNVRRVDADLLHRLGPRVGRAVRSLAAVIHPEVFGNVAGDTLR
jgi:ABC-type Fe3+-hydroxamate transport system substrate-binding protein